MHKINCILLVDDDLAGNAFHTIAINQSNACNHVKTAANGLKALDYLRQCATQPGIFPSPDLIFLDINMPRMNGFEFLDAYKKLESKTGLNPVIIMLTTSSNPEDIKRAGNYREVAEFQNKPLTVRAIREISEKYFSKAKQG